MAWTEVGNKATQGGQYSSPVQKWNATGQSVEGVLRPFRSGKFGPLLVVETVTGEVVYGTSSVLMNKFKEGGIQPGDKIRVEYLGKKLSANGTEYRNFSVQVDRDAKPAFQTGPKIQPADPEFDRLVGLIRKDKGDSIASALAAAAKISGDPVASLRDAMDQLGVVQF